jgi:hypothetical protein
VNGDAFVSTDATTQIKEGTEVRIKIVGVRADPHDMVRSTADVIFAVYSSSSVQKHCVALSAVYSSSSVQKHCVALLWLSWIR